MASPQQYSVSLIDDDRIYQFTAKKILESTGLTKDIHAFYNGQEAVEYLTQHSKESTVLPDIIFLDINMPVMDGWQFLESFQELHSSLAKNIIIYMVSSSVDGNDIRRSKEYKDVTEYIIKPITRDRFEQLLQEPGLIA
jgi:CheY-like chemotaxis protein